MFLMNESAKSALRHFPMIAFNISCPSPEELLKVECRVLYVIEAGQCLAKVKGEDIEPWESSIWIRIPEVIKIPLGLGLLLHHIVPSINLVFLVIFEQIERSSGQIQDAGIFSFEQGNHILSELCLGSFMSLVNDYKVIFGGKYCGVFVELTTGQLSTTQVLH